MAAPRYSKDQPTGFTNRIERVAIIGASGQIGQYLTKALIDNGKHTVTVITRQGSKGSFPEGVKVARVNYEDEESVATALKGQQCLLVSLAVGAPQGTLPLIITAAAKAGVSWIMPNAWGIDFYNNEALGNETLTRERGIAVIRAVEEAGVSSWISMVSGFWYEYSLAKGLPWFGFDIGNKKAQLCDDGSERINTSTWEQCGRAVASLFSLKELPEDENDNSPSISQWRNQPLYISSFAITQKEMLESVNRVTGLKDADWHITYEPSDARHARGQEMLKKGNHTGFPIQLYSRGFFPNGDGLHETQHKLANEVLGLPKEDLDTATTKAVEMANNGFTVAI